MYLLPLVLVNCIINCISRHLKLELLTQFPASNDEKYLYFVKIYILLKHWNFQNDIIWKTRHLLYLFQWRCIMLYTLLKTYLHLAGQRLIFSRLIVIFDFFYQPIKSMLSGIGWVFKHDILQVFGLKLNTDMINLYTLEVVGRGRGTQLQVGGNLNPITSSLRQSDTTDYY